MGLGLVEMRLLLVLVAADAGGGAALHLQQLSSVLRIGRSMQVRSLGCSMREGSLKRKV